MGAAAHRAAHQVLEQGRIFRDPLALEILGEDADRMVRLAAQDESKRGYRLFIAARTRFAEDALAQAVEHGVGQLVVLGAGLDTYAYRGACRGRLRIFEVDHPATQEWKRARLRDAGIPVPDGLTFAPVDFERQALRDGLAAAGFDPARQTFFTWLGVVPYLTEDAVWSTLQFIAGLSGGAEVVFDYSDPPATLSAESRMAHETRAARVASIGEAWKSFFEADELRVKLTGIGFMEVEDLGPRDIVARYLLSRGGDPRDRGGHIVHARTAAR